VPLFETIEFYHRCKGLTHTHEWQSDHMTAPSLPPLPFPPPPYTNRYYKSQPEYEPEPEYYKKKEEGPNPYLYPVGSLEDTLDAKN
jgi:hypothetical protein